MKFSSSVLLISAKVFLSATAPLEVFLLQVIISICYYYVSNQLSFSKRDDLSEIDMDFEMFWIEIETNLYS